MSYPGKYRFKVRQGSTFRRTFTWTLDDDPVDLTGWTARMDVRKTVNSSTAVLSLTTENGRIALGGDEGTIEVVLPASLTEELAPGRYVYDLELVDDSEVTALLEGTFSVDAEVTRG